ncbi:hypothetical protein PRIPAC_85991, partial [Pristionchus pacificus]|uniref:Uncharacterized protein n=1 Tax=Pristionchus pacificus TaxID=54126 RepID=A0A2A6BSJ5_PRIPA
NVMARGIKESTPTDFEERNRYLAKLLLSHECVLSLAHRELLYSSLFQPASTNEFNAHEPASVHQSSDRMNTSRNCKELSSCSSLLNVTHSVQNNSNDEYTESMLATEDSEMKSAFRIPDKSHYRTIQQPTVTCPMVFPPIGSTFNSLVPNAFNNLHNYSYKEFTTSNKAVPLEPRELLLPNSPSFPNNYKTPVVPLNLYALDLFPSHCYVVQTQNKNL